MALQWLRLRVPRTGGLGSVPRARELAPTCCNQGFIYRN